MHAAGAVPADCLRHSRTDSGVRIIRRNPSGGLRSYCTTNRRPFDRNLCERCEGPETVILCERCEGPETMNLCERCEGPETVPLSASFGEYSGRGTAEPPDPGFFAKMPRKTPRVSWLSVL